jgi:hypothetical protein
MPRIEDKHGIHSEEAWEAADRCGAMGHEVNAICWKLATTLAASPRCSGLRTRSRVPGLEWPDDVSPLAVSFTAEAQMMMRRSYSKPCRRTSNQRPVNAVEIGRICDQSQIVEVYWRKICLGPSIRPKR